MSVKSANPVQLYGANPDGSLAPVTMDGSGNLNTGATFSGTVSIGTVSINDGGDATQGAKADAAATADTGTFSVVAILKRIVAKLSGIATNTTGLATEATLALAKADLDAIVTNTAGGGGGGTVEQGAAGLDPWLVAGTVAVSNPTDVSALATEATLGDAKADLDAIATNTGAAATHATTPITISGGVGALGANAARVSASFLAAVDNAATIMVDGWPLAPGAFYSLRVKDAFAMTGTDGDVLYATEEAN